MRKESEYMKKIFCKIKEMYKSIMATFAPSYCYDHMEVDGNAGFGTCYGDGTGDFGICSGCPYYVSNK